MPAQGNLPGRIEDGAVHGLGASDMKGGVAVMLELARWLARRAELGVDLAFLFFPREEVCRSRRARCRRSSTTRSCSTAPSSSSCSSRPTTRSRPAASATSNARLDFHGESAHSARPWTGVNAIDRRVEGLAPARWRSSRVDVEIDGLVFREVRER